MRDRLKSKPAEEIINYLFEPSIKKDLHRSYDNMLYIIKAHLIMLMDEKIVSKEDGQKILSIVKEMEKEGPDIIEIDPSLEELYFNLESFIINRVGVKVGGQMHTGRSRNDLYATVTRINTRESLVHLTQLIVQLRKELFTLAEKNLDVVMPGYTHSQPAEPITFAHYITGVSNALARDTKRIINIFDILNESPLGSGAMASTTFPINRHKTAELLGFDSPLENSIDGVASRDYLMETLSSLNIFLSNLSRFSYDLYIWSTYEFGMVEVDDNVAAVSSIMPQKKNPITFEHIKSKVAHVQGAYISISSVLKNIPFSHTRDSSIESLKYFWDALVETEAAIQLLLVTIKSLKVNKEIMLSRAKENLCTVTELANTLVREEGLSFREAHSIVAKFVVEKLKLKETNIKEEQEILRKITLADLGREICLSKSKLKLALEPFSNVNAKQVMGGPAPDEVKRQLEKLMITLHQHDQILQEKVTQYQMAKKQLNDVINEVENVSEIS